MKIFQDVVAFINKYLFVIITAALAVFAYLYHRRGRTIRDQYYEIEKMRIKGKIDVLTEKAKISEDRYEKSVDQYNKYKSLHADAFKRHGIM